MCGGSGGGGVGVGVGGGGMQVKWCSRDVVV